MHHSLPSPVPGVIATVPRGLTFGEVGVCVRWGCVCVSRPCMEMERNHSLSTMGSRDQTQFIRPAKQALFTC